ncbi:hypothetical protein L208DRAFT_1414862 [Tricholoma matsutake]|nr:hypothetical protein L208DRAFT_1414862 [Tricholoma matsutake 945]
MLGSAFDSSLFQSPRNAALDEDSSTIELLADPSKQWENIWVHESHAKYSLPRNTCTTWRFATKRGTRTAAAVTNVTTQGGEGIGSGMGGTKVEAC